MVQGNPQGDYMIPHGAIVTSWHLSTLLFFAPRKWLKSLALISVILGATLPYAVSAVALKYERSGIPAMIYERTTNCGTDKSNIPDKALILRLDDVQAHSWRDIAVEMMDDAIRRKLLVTSVTIPYKLQTDMELVNMLRARHCYLDITLHGYYNSENPPEFLNLNYDEAAWRYEQGLVNLKMLSNQKVQVFIPPENLLSADSVKAAADRGIQISAEGYNYLDYDASSYNFHDHYLLEVPEVIHQCETAWATENKCILMLHPQDYATNGQKDDQKYQRYTKLLDELINRGANTSTLTALANK